MSVRVFLRRKVLTPTFRTDRALDEPAHVRRLEIQADFAALLFLRMILVLGIRLAHLLLCRRPPRGPDGRRSADGRRRASEQCPSRNRGVRRAICLVRCRWQQRVSQAACSVRRCANGKSFFVAQERISKSKAKQSYHGERYDKCLHDLRSKRYRKAENDCAYRRQQLPVIERRRR